MEWEPTNGLVGIELLGVVLIVLQHVRVRHHTI